MKEAVLLKLYALVMTDLDENQLELVKEIIEMMEESEDER